MKHIEEFSDDYKLSNLGSIIGIRKTAKDKLMEWQRSFKGQKPTIISIQKTNEGLFVVYEK